MNSDGARSLYFLRGLGQAQDPALLKMEPLGLHLDEHLGSPEACTTARGVSPDLLWPCISTGVDVTRNFLEAYFLLMAWLFACGKGASSFFCIVHIENNGSLIIKPIFVKWVLAAFAQGAQTLTISYGPDFCFLPPPPNPQCHPLWDSCLLFTCQNPGPGSSREPICFQADVSLVGLVLVFCSDSSQLPGEKEKPALPLLRGARRSLALVLMSALLLGQDVPTGRAPRRLVVCLVTATALTVLHVSRELCLFLSIL